MKHFAFAVTLIISLGIGLRSQGVGGTMALDGPWRFALDRTDTGVQDRWHARTLEGRVTLPGSLQAQGAGDEVTIDTTWTGRIVDRSWFTAPEYAAYRQPGNVKVPFWLQPARTYVGAAWYQRDFDVPVVWKDRRIVLYLERAHWGTTVWVDSTAVGGRDGLSVPHDYDLSQLATPGRHRLTIRVDNRLLVPVGVDAHSISDQTQTNWNGLIGRLALEVTPRVWIDDLQVFPNAAARSVTVKGRVRALDSQARPETVRLSVAPARRSDPVSKPIAVRVDPQAGGGFEVDCALGAAARPWDEFDPVLYALTASLAGSGHARTVTFGLRDVGVRGTQITINGRAVFLRGTLECAIFPLTGYPPTDVPAWLRILRIARAHGLNHLRFHSWCPPEAAFTAADEMGFYFYVECPTWTAFGDGGPIDRWTYEESARMLKAYGNHPSFIMMSAGNEPSGKNHQAYLTSLVRHWKDQDPRRLYAAAAGWPTLTVNDFHSSPRPRIQAWGDGLASRINARPPETLTDYREFIEQAGRPVVSHEIGQWCAYPDFSEIDKYAGLLKPKNFEIFRDRLEARGMLDQARDFLMASGKLQALCYKEDIESALRTRGMAGFELLDLHDFPGQGTALVGVLDPFWNSKGYITADRYRRFSGATVPLARLPRRILTNREALEAQVEVAHFGPHPMSRAVASWQVTDGARRIVAEGRLAPRDLPTGELTALGSFSLPLERFGTAARLTLEVALDGTPFANDWDVWVYPASVETPVPPDVTVVTALDPATMDLLERGGRVVLLAPPDRVRGDTLGRVKIGFSAIFWNTAWTSRQAPHTLGILCDPAHPALAGFPTESHSNWQWWELVSRSHPFILNDTSPDFRPIVQVIDDWFTARKLGLVFEARVGRGRLLGVGIDLSGDLGERPVARQLLGSLLAYAGSERFRPTRVMAPAAVTALLDR